MQALEYVNHVIRSGQLKAKQGRSLTEERELSSLQVILRKYEAENPQKAAMAMNLLISDRLQAREGLTH